MIIVIVCTFWCAAFVTNIAFNVYDCVGVLKRIADALEKLNG